MGTDRGRSTNRRYIAPYLHSHSTSEDEDLECKAAGHLLTRAFADLEPQSASGISFKSQVLYLIVYITRYLGGYYDVCEVIEDLAKCIMDRPFLDLHQFRLPYDL